MKTSSSEASTRPPSRFHAAVQRLSAPFLNKGEGPPDLDELWRDFNKKLTGMFGGKGGGTRPPTPGDGGNFQPDMKSAGIGVGLIAGVAALLWLGSGFFVVQST